MTAAVFSTSAAVIASTPTASTDHRGRIFNFACPSCPRRFAFQCRLAAHLRCHTNQRPFICPDCGRSFTQRGYLVRHAAVHKLDRPFICDVCPRAYKHYGSLVNHKRTHSQHSGAGVALDDDSNDDGCSKKSSHEFPDEHIKEEIKVIHFYQFALSFLPKFRHFIDRVSSL